MCASDVSWDMHSIVSTVGCLQCKSHFVAVIGTSHTLAALDKNANQNYLNLRLNAV
jgi:hypothetical protein